MDLNAIVFNLFLLFKSFFSFLFIRIHILNTAKLKSLNVKLC